MPGKDRTESDLFDFVDTAVVGLHWVDAAGTILWANPADYEPLGYVAAEYVGRNIVEFHADADAIADILRRLTAGECLHNHEAHLRCKNGSTRKVLISSSVRFNDAGEFMHTRCFTIDISNRRPEGAEIQVEALSREVERLAILASRERGLVEAILTHSPHGIIVSDAKGKLILQNKAAEKIWGGSASPVGIEGWGMYRAYHANGRPYEPADWSMARAIRNEEVSTSEEIHFQRFDDTHGTLLGSTAPIFAPNGELDGALSVFSDITRLKAQEDELRVGAARYLTTLKSIGDAVVATDAGGKVTFLNSSAEALTGWTLDEACGVPLSEIFQTVNEQTHASIECPGDKVLRDRDVVNIASNTVLVARDGRKLAVDGRGAPIFNAKNEVAGVVLVVRDVGEKRSEEDRRRFLAQASTLLASSLDYAPTLASVTRLAVPVVADWCAVHMVEPDGSIECLAVTQVDPTKERWAKELHERYLSDPRSAHGVHEVIRVGGSQILPEIPGSHRVGAEIDEQHLQLIVELGLKSSMIVPLRCRGRTLGAITFVSAESGRTFGANDQSLAEELANVAALAVDNARLYREAQDANRAKDEFLATISHELRTPLTAMLGWASLLRSRTLPSDRHDHALATIERNARAQSQLIEDLLDVSRIISGNLRLELRPLDLAPIVEAATDAVRPAAEAKGVRIDFLIDESARQVRGDAGRLQQVTWNLLSNAVKFTDKGGSVTIRLARADSGAELQVTDTGRGIEASFLPHIFERFRQANGTSTRSHGGLGLGLAIVKHLVELHGGTVTAASAGLQRGSSFRIRLPISMGTEGDVEPVLSSRIRAPRLDGLRVLVVDDELDARTLIATILEGHGAQVSVVGSAAQALGEIERRRPDVLVSDIGMPGEDGYSLIRKVRSSNNAKALPAAALTAYARTEDRTRAMLAGFQHYVSKPIEANELLVVIAMLAGRAGEAAR